MRSLALLSVALAALSTAVQGRNVSERDYYEEEESSSSRACLCEDEAWEIARGWLSIWSTPGISSKEELATIVSEDIGSYDDSFSPPVFGIDALYNYTASPGGGVTVTNVTQVPLILLHDCDQIAYNWKYDGFATGVNATVPAGTPVSFTGNDILRVDLETRLISNATSCGDWIVLARQLGSTCTF